MTGKLALKLQKRVHGRRSSGGSSSTGLDAASSALCYGQRSPREDGTALTAARVRLVSAGEGVYNAVQ